MSEDLNNNLDDSIKQMKNAVLLKKPIFKHIWEKHGSDSLYFYAKDYIDVNTNELIEQRQDELISVIKEEATKLLGAEMAESIGNQLKKYYFVSTADHLGPISHPFFINSNLMVSAAFHSTNDPLLQNIIVLSCSNISFDNSSFPRGLLFSNYEDGKVNTVQLPFFPRSVRPCPVFNSEPFTKEGLEKVRVNIRELISKNKIATNISDKLNKLIDEVYDQDDVLLCKKFSHQITKTNYKLWKFFFRNSNKKIPNLVYIEQENIVMNLLVRFHMDQETDIHKILFDEKYYDLIVKNFNDIFGGFCLERKVGTYLFWALPKGSKYRVQLWKKGNFLETDDGTFRVELKPDNIRAALINKEIFPSTLLSFIILAFYYGLKLLGGFSQVNYLTSMKDAFMNLFTEVGNYEAVERCAKVQTKELICGPTVAFLEGEKGEIVPANGLDMYLYGHDDMYDCLEKLFSTMTLEEGLYSLLPELYRVIYSDYERSEKLMSVTPDDISKYTGFDKKIRPCVSIKKYEK